MEIECIMGDSNEVIKNCPAAALPQLKPEHKVRKITDFNSRLGDVLLSL